MEQTAASNAGQMDLRRLVRSYLEGLMASGEKRLALQEEVRPILREWMLAARRGGVAGKLGDGLDSPRPDAQATTPEESAPSRANETGVSLRAMMGEAPEAPTEPVTKDPVFFRPAGRTREEIWEQAKSLLARWEPLRELGTLRDKMVWGEGSPDADIIFVGDAPNYYDEREGRPFCGEAGTKLDEMLRAMGLTRKDVYITHLVKYRPKMARQTTNNRAPDMEEIRLSMPVLEFEVRYVRPKVIVALGVVAARGIIGQGELPLSAYQQMKGCSYCGASVVVTHHPSYLLRTSILAERRKLWEEMLRVMELAHLPISAKQRGYFLPKD